MSRGLAVLLGAGAGCLVGLQAPVNARLKDSVGSVQAATFSFLVGTIALLVIAAFVRGGWGDIAHFTRAPAWTWVGGLFGATYVTVAIVAVRTLGVSGLTAVVISGQLVISVVIDRFGLLGVARRSIDTPRIVGLALLLAGAFLVVRK